MLYGGTGAGSTGNSDSFKTAVIDTIVAEVQSTPGEDRCVLLLGYKHQIEEMFQVRLSPSSREMIHTTRYLLSSERESGIGKEVCN